MTLTIVIVLIVLLPIALVVIVRRRRLLRVNALQVLLEILGIFLLVSGLFLLFVAFNLMFNEKVTVASIGFFVVSLAFVFGGYGLTKRTSQKSKTG